MKFGTMADTDHDSLDDLAVLIGGPYHGVRMRIGPNWPKPVNATGAKHQARRAIYMPRSKTGDRDPKHEIVVWGTAYEPLVELYAWDGCVVVGTTDLDGNHANVALHTFVWGESV